MKQESYVNRMHPILLLLILCTTQLLLSWLYSVPRTNCEYTCCLIVHIDERIRNYVHIPVHWGKSSSARYRLIVTFWYSYLHSTKSNLRSIKSNTNSIEIEITSILRLQSTESTYDQWSRTPSRLKQRWCNISSVHSSSRLQYFE